MAQITPQPDWRPLRTEADWKARPRLPILIVHQRNPIGDEAPTKFHGRDCRDVQHRVFRQAPLQGKGNADWFSAPDAQSALDGGAKPCQHCGGQ